MSMPVQQRDTFIDFLKGVCIICVVLTHSLPVEAQKCTAFALWGQMAVPLFLMLQAYHVFNSARRRYAAGLPPVVPGEADDFGRLWRRIVRPFVVVTVLTAAALAVERHDIRSVIVRCVNSGGIGPGSYYVWIYVQFMLMLPMLAPLFLHYGAGWRTLLPFILASQGAEWLCMAVELPEQVYRLTYLRYIFLIYLGYVWTTNRISSRLTPGQIVISIISMCALAALYYSDCSLQPWLHDTAWRTFHWVCYFYAGLLLPRLIHALYNAVPERVRRAVAEAGRYSYEIFLWQMAVFVLLPLYMPGAWRQALGTPLYVVLSTLTAILPVMAWKRGRTLVRAKDFC